jgi:hypothetical protein
MGALGYEKVYWRVSDLPSSRSPLKIYRMGVRRGDIYARMFELLQKAGKIPIACNENCLASPEFRMNLEHLELKIIPEHIITMPDRAKNLFTIGNSLTPQVIDMIKNGRIKTVALHDDKVAAGLINGLLEKGYSVPDDISVIGFDNIDASAYFKIPLTTIELPILNNTVMAVESILSGKDIPMHIESAGKIIWRESAKI